MEILIKVNSTYNNTIVSALYKGKILKTISTGSLGFKKAKRASTLAAQSCGEALGSWLLLLSKNYGQQPSGHGRGESRTQRSTSQTTENQLQHEYSLLLDAKKKLSSFKGNSNLTSPQTLWQSRGNQDSRLNKNFGTQERKNTVNSTKLNISLLIAGVGYGKFGVIRGLSKLGVKIKTISDVTSIPHNGCKPPKMRRK
jgi:ribosomal protein S11